MAEFFNVSEQTLNTWKHVHLEFLESLKLGKETADRRVEQSLYRRAIGYSYDAEKVFVYLGQPVKVPYVRDVVTMTDDELVEIIRRESNGRAK